MRRSVAVLFALAMVGCERSAPGSQAPKRFTIDGVLTVENPPRAVAPVAFHLGDSVVRDIGGLKENADDEFNHRNGFLAGVVLEHGGLAVIDWTRVRLFDSTGRPTAVVGRKGRGPNEFSGLTEICRFEGDSLRVYDSHTRRASVIAPSGTIVSQHVVQQPGMHGVGCFDDGSHVSQSYQNATVGTVLNAVASRVRADGSVLDTIGTFPLPAFHGFGQYVRLHVRGDVMYVSDPRKNDVKVFGSDGTLRRIVRMGDKARRMSERDATHWLGGPVAVSGSGTKEPTQSPSSSTWPFYRGLLVDRSHRLWVQDFPSGEDAAERWTAYDSTGAVLGALDLPMGPRRPAPPGAPPGVKDIPGSRPIFIDAFGDFIILLVRDDDGAAHFVTRRLH